jgi:Flp pilus assembly pilin Flp
VIVEYASLVAAIAVLVSTVSGAFGNALATLPSSSSTAITALNKGARAQDVPAGEARAAYNRAPYQKPVLKYLYAVGFIGGKKNTVSCLFARATRGQTVAEAIVEIRKNRQLVQKLARRGVSVRTAANVLVAGIASACGG